MSYGVELRDGTAGNRITRGCLPFIITPIPLFLVWGTGINYFLWLPAAAGLAALWRGTKVQVPTSDPTVHMRIWDKPYWLIAGGFFTVVTAALTAAITAVTKPNTKLYDWNGEFFGWSETNTMALLWTLAIWGVLTLVAFLLAGPNQVFALVKDLTGRQGGQQRIAQVQAPVPVGVSALQRFTDHMFTSTGLGIKSSNSGLWILPTVIGKALDHMGRPVVTVKMLGGTHTIDTYRKAADRIASAWGVKRVLVSQSPEGVEYVTLTGVLEEFTRSGPVPWRGINASGLSVAEYLSALPMGEMSREPAIWTQSFREANLVCGGIPGAGKSVYLSSLLAHLLGHPHIEIGFIDLKVGVEAQIWRDKLSAVAITPDEALELIEWLVVECEGRYARMRDAGIRNAWTQGFLGASEPVRVLVVDEAAELFMASTADERRRAEAIEVKLRSLVQRGRAAGYVVVIATQKPTATSLPTSIRDLCSTRIAFACRNAVMAAAILTDDWYAEGTEHPDYSPTKIGQDERGTAVVGTETGDYIRVQGAYLGEDQIEDIVAAAPVRQTWHWSSADPGPASDAVVLVSDYAEPDEPLGAHEYDPLGDYAPPPEPHKVVREFGDFVPPDEVAVAEPESDPSKQGWDV